MQLVRIVTSAVFRDSLRLKSFISYVVGTALAGKADRLKAYTIGVEALGRSADFDPQADSIVRVEAGRLRKALRRYYGSEGRNDPLVIDLPRGGYVPTCRRADTDRLDRSPVADDRTGRLAEPGRRSQQLTDSLAEFMKLVSGQNSQVRAVSDAIAAARRTVAQSYALLRRSFDLDQAAGLTSRTARRAPAQSAIDRPLDFPDLA